MLISESGDYEEPAQLEGGDDDTGWLYGYDAWNVPLHETAAADSA